MEQIKSIFAVVIVSALIGAAVGGGFQYVYSGSFFPGLNTGVLTGIVIGTVCNYAFILLYFKYRNAFLSGALVVVIITAGTVFITLADQVIFPLNLMVVASSDIAGVITTILIYRNEKRLNRKLKEKQRELNQDRPV